MFKLVKVSTGKVILSGLTRRQALFLLTSQVDQADIVILPA